MSDTAVPPAADGAARRAAELAARGSYGRLVALLASRTRDIASAEDALSDALLAALRTWPERGVPDNPDAWLLTAARHGLSNQARHRAVADAVAADLLLLADEAAPEVPAIPDDRLKLLFVCAHPAIAAAVRTPLMLQVVLGLDAAQVGAAFLVPATTMGQRLVRAKAKIRDAGLRFELPGPDDLPHRLGDVLEAVYAAYATGRESDTSTGLADEAVYLARLLVALLPAEPEPKGLLALLLYGESRRGARLDDQGRFVPLSRQDARRWDRNRIIEAETMLTAASRSGVFGRFQCEAAIQSLHVQRPITGRLDSASVDLLYGLLLARAPSVGATVARAAARLDAGRAEAALETLAALGDDEVERYQPYWVTRWRVLEALGRETDARPARQRALELTTDPAVRAFLQSATSA